MHAHRTLSTMAPRRRWHACLLGVAAIVTGQAGIAQARLPRPDHIVIVIEENKGYGQIIGSRNAPFINELAAQGASFSRFFAAHHPSQPNYIELFSGSDQGVKNDEIPRRPFTVPSLGGALIRARLTFAGYAEDLPRPGALEAFYPENRPTYARKHCPWIDFADVPAAASQPLTSFPARYEALPTVSFVIPNLINDMHNGRDPERIRRADTWLHDRLSGYAQWCRRHNSLLIVTWDEDNHYWWNRTANHIPTVMVGAMVKPGVYNTSYNHHDLLRTIETMYGLPLLAGSRTARAIDGCWQPAPPAPAHR